MSAYLVLILAALSRLLPHTFHAVGLNITAVGGGLLFFGARRPRSQALAAAAIMAATDVYLTVVAFHYTFHLREYLVTWLWYAAVCLVGHQILARRQTALRVGAAVLASATSFFVLSNLFVFSTSALYPHTAAGLTACFLAAVPFYANDLASTALTAGALFGLPVLAARIAGSLRPAPGSDLA